MMYTNVEHTFAHVSSLTLFSVTPFHWISLIYKPERLKILSGKAMTIAFICMTGFTTTRWIISRHFPLSNLYESSMFLSWSFSLPHIILGIRNRDEWSGIVTAPGAMLTNGFATLGLPGDMQQSTLLVPAPQSHWLMMHVSMMLISYSTLLCGSLLAITLLVILYDRGEIFSIYKMNWKSFTRILFPDMDIFTYERGEGDVKNPFHYLSMNSHKCRLIQQIDQWSYQIISLGFPSLTIGILSGAVWANEAWGSHWNWDPKETWALITWLIYAIYIHIRMTKSWRGKGPAIAASTGFSSVRIRFLGVNPSGIGLHNYGWLITTSGK
uniref:cytochrome c heme attachment protein n=1 Tax=Diplopterygium chinense TaxID=397680 RepID=UPI002028800B|nr:cytochrome c heme attachment protein [Diplopterygium chinense]QYC93011.1 cytochrome c heme attachment protein [Diplopterygium chinense]